MDLSIVVPVFREAATLTELAERCAAAARATGLEFEVLVVDDASGDGSIEVVRGLPSSLQTRVIELPRNQGQFRATQVGLGDAAGEVVVVLDGDLQDPPEVIPELLLRHRQSRQAPGRRVTFAVKSGRDDPAWFMLGHAAFRGVQRWLGEGPPEGSGSYCALDRDVARRVARVQLEDPNLAWVIAALGYQGDSVPYRKQRRVDGESRVGVLGLAREALSSLFLTTRVGRRSLQKGLVANRSRGRREFVRQTELEICELFRTPSPPRSPLDDAQVETLPPPVRRWARRAGVVGRPRPRSVRLLQRGQLRASVGAPFMTARADQYFRIPDPAFIWRVETKLFRLFPFTGRDRYADGSGSMRIALASRLYVVDAADEKIAEGALLRFLAETVWFPSAALEPYVAWTAIDETHASATLRHAGLEVSATFEVDALGRVLGIVAQRYLGGGEGATKRTWQVTCTHWERLSVDDGSSTGVEVPTAGDVAWDLPSGRFVYYRWRVTELEYDRPEPFAEQRVWK